MTKVPSGAQLAVRESPSPFTSRAAASSNIYKTNRANTNVVTSDSEGGCRVNNKINTICMCMYSIFHHGIYRYLACHSVQMHMY